VIDPIIRLASFAVDLAPLALLVAVVVGVAVARRLARATRRSFGRWQRRTVDAAFTGLFAALFGRWLDQRRPARPPVLTGDDIYRACPLSAWQGAPNTCRWCDRPLPERRPRFCGPQCADLALDNHVFDRARSARRRIDSYQCTKCGSTRHLEVHHANEPAHGRHAEDGCMHHLDGLRTLCGGGGVSCHQRETNRQRRNGDFGPRRRWVS
jgi:predicted RNA-binding Zn-ribbon protein involved in translation (DUF1610 family)